MNKDPYDLRAEAFRNIHKENENLREEVERLKMEKNKLCKCVDKCERQGPGYFCPYVPEIFGPSSTCKLIVNPKLLEKKPWWKIW